MFQINTKTLSFCSIQNLDFILCNFRSSIAEKAERCLLHICILFAINKDKWGWPDTLENMYWMSTYRYSF